MYILKGKKLFSLDIDFHLQLYTLSTSLLAIYLNTHILRHRVRIYAYFGYEVRQKCHLGVQHLRCQVSGNQVVEDHRVILELLKNTQGQYNDCYYIATYIRRDFIEDFNSVFLCTKRYGSFENITQGQVSNKIVRYLQKENLFMVKNIIFSL